MPSGSFLAEQLRKGFAADPWHGPATSDLLRGLDAKLSAAKPSSGAHSIWELVGHMTAWQREVLRRLRGGRPGLPEDGDWPAVAGDTDAAWQRSCGALASSLLELADAASRLSADQLTVVVGTSDRPLGTGVTVAEMLVGMVAHNAYHSGQIALLRKSLGV
jgi:uncharacterized damage-inducible protein DinB